MTSCYIQLLYLFKKIFFPDVNRLIFNNLMHVFVQEGLAEVRWPYFVLDLYYNYGASILRVLMFWFSMF